MAKVTRASKGSALTHTELDNNFNELYAALEDTTGEAATGGTGGTTTSGTAGTNGWSPVLAIVSDGERRVLRITDWTGGTGTKPSTGYVAASGELVATAAAAVDIRGAAGAAGTGGTASSSSAPITLADAATVPVDATTASFFSLTATSAVGATRQLGKPTGVATGQAKSIVVFFKQDATGGRLLTFAAGISPAVGVDTAPNAVTRLVLTTLDGGATYTVDGGGTPLAALQRVAINEAGVEVAVPDIRTVSLGAYAAPVSGDVWRSPPMPWAGTVLGVRVAVDGTATPTITGTVGVNAAGVANLQTQTYGAAATARRDATAAAPSRNFVAGDVLRFTHTAAPGGTVTSAVVGIEVVQR